MKCAPSLLANRIKKAQPSLPTGVKTEEKLDRIETESDPWNKKLWWCNMQGTIWWCSGVLSNAKLNFEVNMKYVLKCGRTTEMFM